MMRSQLLKPSILLPARIYELTCSSVMKRFVAQTSSDNPTEFSKEDIGKFYTVPEKTSNALQLKNLVPRTYRQQLKMFDECTWLFRTQTLEIINCLKAVNPTVPSVRIVLWGKHGSGKSISFYQALQYAWNENFVLVTIRNAMDLTRTVKDVQLSSYRDGRIDTPRHSKNFLLLFKHQNAHIYRDLSKLITERAYTWPKDEIPEGSPIIEIIEKGIQKTHLATDCVGILFRELQRHSTKGDIKLLLAVDMANSLYGTTKINRSTGRRAPPEEISFCYFIRKFFTTEWFNGACLLVADKRDRSHFADRYTIPLDTPLELFGEKGLADLDPFIPIETKNYTEQEIENIYEYYKEKSWLVNPKSLTHDGKLQLKFLSGYNPFDFERLCSFN